MENNHSRVGEVSWRGMNSMNGKCEKETATGKSPKVVEEKPKGYAFLSLSFTSEQNRSTRQYEHPNKARYATVSCPCPDVVMSPQNTGKINNKGEINFRDLDVNLQDLDLNFPPPKCEQANGLDFSRVTNTDVIPDVMEKIIDVILKMHQSTREADQLSRKS